MKNVTKKDNTYYADFRSPDGTRIRKSLGKDKVQAKRQLLQIMADCTFTAETQSVIPKSNKSISFKFAANAFMMSTYKIEDASDKNRIYPFLNALISVRFKTLIFFSFNPFKTNSIAL